MNDEQKKFLDENGLRILWNQISMHDYPNNAALTSVINAIDANKADKADIPRIDTTLSAAGAAADAKAVGQAIENIELIPGPKGDSGVYVGSGEIPAGYNVQIDPTGEASVLVQSVNGVKPDSSGNVEIELSNSGGGGGNVSYYETSLVTEEDVYSIKFPLPAEAKKFYMWKLAYVTPDTGVTDERVVYLVVGGTVKNLGATHNHGSVGLSGIQHTPGNFAVGIMTRPDLYIEHCSAGFLSGSGNLDPKDGRNDIELVTNNGIVFPAGTKVWFWGVYYE